MVQFDAVRFTMDRFTPFVGKIGAPEKVSGFDIVNGDWASLQLIETYHTLESSFSGHSRHKYGATGLIGTFHLFFSEALEVITNSGNGMEVIGRINGGGRNQEVSSIRVVRKAKGVKAFWSRFEFNDFSISVNFENPAAISAVIGNMMLFGKKEEGKNIGNASLVDVDLVRTEIGNIGGGHDTVVAMDFDGSGSCTDVVDVSGI